MNANMWKKYPQQSNCVIENCKSFCNVTSRPCDEGGEGTTPIILRQDLDCKGSLQGDGGLSVRLNVGVGVGISSVLHEITTGELLKKELASPGKKTLLAFTAAINSLIEVIGRSLKDLCKPYICMR